MDDVWLVIGLLLFGSLLFCLCCYKVTNLLYMLYHIDDETSIDDFLNSPIPASAVAAATAVAAAGAGGGGGSSGGCAGDSTAHDTTTAYDIGIHKQDYSLLNNSTACINSNCNHIGDSNHIPSLRFNTHDKSNSVSSLNVGIQCNPVDTLSLSELRPINSQTSLIAASTSTPSIFSHHIPQKHHFHSPSMPDCVNASHSTRVGYGTASSRAAVTTASAARHLIRQQPTSSSSLNEFRMATIKRGNRSGSFHHPYQYNSLSRLSRFREDYGDVTEEELDLPDWQLPHQHHHHHQQQQQQLRQQPTSPFTQPQPSPSAEVLGSKQQPRRYGSIRVAECSFVEQNDPCSPPITSVTCQHHSSRATGDGSHYLTPVIQHSHHHQQQQQQHRRPSDSFQASAVSPGPKAQHHHHHHHHQHSSRTTTTTSRQVDLVPLSQYSSSIECVQTLMAAAAAAAAASAAATASSASPSGDHQYECCQQQQQQQLQKQLTAKDKSSPSPPTPRPHPTSTTSSPSTALCNGPVITSLNRSPVATQQVSSNYIIPPPYDFSSNGTRQHLTNVEDPSRSVSGSSTSGSTNSNSSGSNSTTAQAKRSRTSIDNDENSNEKLTANHQSSHGTATTASSSQAPVC